MHHDRHNQWREFQFFALGVILGAVIVVSWYATYLVGR